MLNLTWQNLLQRFQALIKLADLNNKKKKKDQLAKQMTDPDFWQKVSKASRISQVAENLTVEIRRFNNLDKKIKEAIALAKIAEAEDNQAVLADLEKTKAEILKEIISLEEESLFTGDYDDHGAILSIHAGTGGIDAQDWAQILERMYLRFAEKMNWPVKIINRLSGQEAGLKTCSLKIDAYQAYAWLKGEHGVHRLGRISPFDGEGLRQTSFALVEIIPDLEDPKLVKIKEEDLKIDVYRSSGPGGQSVNTTDSAVRISHLPSGIVVACQSERSQHQNKENALQILKAKLFQIKQAEKQAKTSRLKGKAVKAEWGRQIRSYILYGKQIVKDHRSQLSRKDPKTVLDGDLKPFALAYLRLKDKAN